MAVLRSSGVSLLASYIVLNVLSIAAVGLRFICIRIFKRKIRAHDCLCVLALLCSVAYSIDTLIGTIDGELGVHIAAATQHPTALVLTLKTFFASEWFWATGVCSFRISMLLLYLDIFPNRKFRWSAYVCIGFVSAFWIGSVITILVSCRPIQKNWHPEIPGKCEDIGTAEMAAAAINMVLDLLIVALPLPLIWRLRMSTEKKLGVSVTFALGVSIAGINAARIAKVVDCDVEDFTYCTRDSAILTVAETAIGVIVACVPTLGGILHCGRRSPATQARVYANRWPGGSDGSRERFRSHTNSANTRHRATDHSDDEMIYTGSNFIKPRIFVSHERATGVQPVIMGVVGVRRDVEVTSEAA